MKATGIVRKVDDLGRLVIPMETRKTLGIGVGEPMEFFVEGDVIVLKKYDTTDSVAELLKKMEMEISLKEGFMATEKLHGLLQKVQEMREIINEP